jgi:hypothetical protein
MSASAPAGGGRPGQVQNVFTINQPKNPNNHPLPPDYLAVRAREHNRLTNGPKLPVVTFTQPEDPDQDVDMSGWSWGPPLVKLPNLSPVSIA